MQLGAAAVDALDNHKVNVGKGHPVIADSPCVPVMSGYLGSRHFRELIELIAAWVTCDRCVADRSRRSRIARGAARATQVQVKPTVRRRIDAAFTDQMAYRQRLRDQVARGDQQALERIFRSWLAQHDAPATSSEI